MSDPDEYRQCIREYFNDPGDAELLMMMIDYAERTGTELDRWKSFQVLWHMIAEAQFIQTFTEEKWGLNRDVDSRIGRMT